MAWSSKIFDVNFSFSQLTFVNHHDGKEEAKDTEKGAVDVVLDTNANLLGEAKHQDARSDKGGDAESNVSERPSVIKCTKNKNDLREGVDRHTNDGEQQLHDPKADLFRGREAADGLERAQGDEEADGPE